MAREFDGPLTKKDLEWLRSRYNSLYVGRMVELHGVAKGSGKAEKDAEAAKVAEAEAEQREAEEAAAEAVAQAEAEAAAAAEDLIGGSATDEAPFDVLGSTEAEVRDWAGSADDETKAAALSTEQDREDRDPRKGVVALLS